MSIAKFPLRRVGGISDVADAIIDLIKWNIIAKTNVTSNAMIGDTVVNVENAFQFRPEEEIVLIDYGYNVEGSEHYNIFEYAKIKEVNNTHAITLSAELEGNWTTANNSFVQKTIGHSPLYENNLYYGDREVIPPDQVAITVEPQSVSNEWIYLQGGLSEEFRLQINIYGKDVKMDEGRRILDKYSDAVYQLLNDNLHVDVNTVTTPLISDAPSGATQVIIADTQENRDNFVVYNPATQWYEYAYQVQDNSHISAWCGISSRSISGGLIRLTLNYPLADDFSLDEFAIIKRINRYFYDSRVDGIEYGVISKGSAVLRASQLSWYGKWVNEHSFPQTTKNVEPFTEIQPDESSSES